MAEPRIVSIHLGQPRDYIDAEGRSWRTAIAKEAAGGSLPVTALGFAGDAVADTRHHGGLHQAVMVYSRHHQIFWRERLGLEIGPGGLGENLSVEGLDDESARIGDVFEAGSALLQVSQPRQPCNTLSRYWRCPELLPAIWETARSGWYFRVLREGMLAPGDSMRLVARAHADWSAARLLRALRDAATRPAEALAASGLEHLTPAWREKLRAKAGG